MAYIDWDYSFELGIEPFDEHHRHLVSLINKSYNSYLTEASSEEVGDVLEELISYASYHFNAEELWMKELNYPNYNKHTAEHFKYSTKLIIFKNDYRRGKKNLSLDIFIFLKEWLIDHIVKSDSEYKKFIATRGVDKESV